MSQPYIFWGIVLVAILSLPPIYDIAAVCVLVGVWPRN